MTGERLQAESDVAEGHAPEAAPPEVDPGLVAELDADAVQALREWQQAKECRVYLDAPLDGGYTRARVATVVVDQAGTAPRKLILKASPAGSAGAAEGDVHQRALTAGPTEFVEQHLVDQPFPPITTAEGGLVMFQEIAGGSLEEFRPLSSQYNSDRLPKAARQVAASLLTEWCPDPGVERLSLQDCVRKQLGHRGKPKGALSRWAEIVGEARDSRWLRFAAEGHALPNPLVWLDGDEELGTEDLLFLHGRAHGDLHLDNIMVRLVPELDPGSFRLIDLTTWSDSAPLCRDIPHLLLATIGKHLGSLTAPQQTSLADRVLDLLGPEPPGPGSLENQGLEALADALLHAGDEWASGMNLLEDWRRQVLVGVLASALIQASVSVHPVDSRWWFFELASRALARLIRPYEPAGEVAGLGPLAGQDVDALAAAERLDDLADAFGTRKATVLVIGEDGLTDPAVVARQPWDIVIEFDPRSDREGAYKHRAHTRDNRLVTFSQSATFAPQTIVWVAADGLEGATAPEGLRDWRRSSLPGLRKIFNSFARSSTRPTCICTAGPLGGKARASVEALLDSLSSRVDLMVLNAAGGDELADYEPEAFAVNPVATLAALHDRSAPPPGDREPTIPGHEGPVPLTSELLAWHAEVGELVHSRSAVTAPAEALRDGFYRGNKISWFELDIRADVGRRETEALLTQARHDLATRGTFRIALRHYPGAGGTTVARRVAWEVHDEYPALVAERLTDHVPLVSRVRELNKLTDQAQLVVIESTVEAVIDRAYSELRADSVPVVFLLVERRAQAPPAGERSFHLPRLTEKADRQAFAEVFGGRVPERHPSLTRLANSSQPAIEPFLFGLTTYGENYEGLSAYVARSLEEASEPEREVLKLIALVHHYSGLALPDALLAGVLEVPDEVTVNLPSRVSPEVLVLLIEEFSYEWRTSHQLVAHEILVQLLTPPTQVMATREDWKVSLGNLSAALIEQAAREYHDLLPEHVAAIIDQLFIVRDNRSVFAGEQQPFSELLGEIPSLEGRIRVMSCLADAFPEEAHYAAHLGRLLSYQAGDHVAARKAIDRALVLDDEDDTLFHIKGMIVRNQMQAVRANPDILPPAGLSDRVLELVDEARTQFERSIELNDESEYGYVALAQLCTRAIEFGKTQSGAATYGAFLADSDHGYYRELLGVAEDSLDRIREIRGGDRPSAFQLAVENNLHELYDDYQALLQGWRNLLDRHDIAKPPVRRQLVRAYLYKGGRSATWRKATNDDRNKAGELLDQNLADNPRDVQSLLEWLRLSRFRGASLDRASELLSYAASDPVLATRDVLFYDYVVSGLLALGGRDTAVLEFRRKLEKSRERASAFGNRRFLREWYADGTGLAQLVHHQDLSDWDRRAGAPDPGLLSRVEGRVSAIRRPQAGTIDFGSGLNAFFTPGAAGLAAGRDENRRVSFLLGFAYEGPQTWSVQLLED